MNIPYSNKNDATINKPQELVLHLPFPTAKMNESTLNKIHGSLLGLAIGDALGAPVEFRPYEYMKANPVVDLCEGGTWGLKKGQVIHFDFEENMIIRTIRIFIVYR